MEYAGNLYPTDHEALTAAWVDFLTAGGNNTRETALEFANQGVAHNVAVAADDGWRWPGDSESDPVSGFEHQEALDAAIIQISNEAPPATIVVIRLTEHADDNWVAVVTGVGGTCVTDGDTKTAALVAACDAIQEHIAAHGLKGRATQ